MFPVVWRPETAIATEGRRESILNRDLLGVAKGIGAQRGRGGRRRGRGTGRGRGNRWRGSVQGVHRVSENTVQTANLTARTVANNHTGLEFQGRENGNEDETQPVPAAGTEKEIEHAAHRDLASLESTSGQSVSKLCREQPT